MGNGRGRWSVAAIGLTLSLAVALALSGILIPASQRAALGATITLTVISGQVTTPRTGGASVELPDGAVLQVGDTVRTGPGARAVLTYFEGSTVEIEPDSEVTIDEAAFGEGGATIIRMTQAVGHTWNVVTKLIKPGSRYEIRTPVSTATVRGTEFEVVVAEATGETRVVTTEGAVATSDTAGTTEVVVTRGLETTVKVNQPPTAPKAAPEPVRRVAVPLNSADNSIVTDAFGRQNGMRDGKIVLQTPGARIQYDASGLVVILPDPSGDSLALVARSVPASTPRPTASSRAAVQARSTTAARSAAPSAATATPTVSAAPGIATSGGGTATSEPQPSVATATPTIRPTASVRPSAAPESSAAPSQADKTTASPAPIAAPSAPPVKDESKIEPPAVEKTTEKKTTAQDDKSEPRVEPTKAPATPQPEAAPAPLKIIPTLVPSPTPKAIPTPKATPTPKPSKTPKPNRNGRNED